MAKRKLQVFISSTYTDLIPERQAAVAAVLKAGHIPAGMELSTAGDKSQWDTITRWIDESDVYMLILGGRYGSIEPVSGASYTELEFDYAVSSGKPLFSVVIQRESLEEKLKKDGSHIIELSRPDLLEQFRTKVLTNISSFFVDEKDIRLTVHESLSELRDSKAAKGWISANEIEDTRPLHDEITRLREEIIRIKSEKLPSSNQKRAMLDNDEFSVLTSILKDLKVTIPKDLTKDKTQDVDSDIYNIFVLNKDQFVIGLTNTSNMQAAASFYYFSVCPKLAIHGLVSDEKIAGSQARRKFVTQKGLDFLAEVDRQYSSQKKTVSALEPGILD